MKARDSGVVKCILISSAMLLATACHEVPQDASKPFAGKKATELYSRNRFNDDKATFEKALAKRAKDQNDYLRIPD